jgi:uncharacterized protein YjdB
MARTRQRLQIFAAITVLLLLALGVGCTGFFQNPQIVTLTIGPQSATIAEGTTIQMTAVATYDDGSTKTLTKDVFWSSDDTSVAPITQSGSVTGEAPGTATITASSGAITGTTTLTVTLNNVTSILIQPQGTQTVALGGSTTYTCLANVSGGQTDVTSIVTWSVTDSTGATASNISITNQTIPATLTVLSSATPGTYTVNASLISNNQTLTNAVTLIVP